MASAPSDGPPVTIALALAAALSAASPAPAEVLLPGGGSGVGFDDLRWVPSLHRLLVPAGGTGRLDLVDPDGGAVDSIPGLSVAPPGKGHGAGTTSADFGAGLLFASDRTARTVVAIDPASRRIRFRAPLGGSPDYVRWVEPRREVWVTEPGREVIEIFRLGAEARLERAGTVRVPGGPESLVVDPGRGWAYANTWRGETLAVGLASRAIEARWPNGCRGSRGIALDAGRGLVFVGCEEGRAVALDLEAGGAVAGQVETGAGGVDLIDWAPARSRLYLAAGDAGELDVVAVEGRGALRLVERLPTARGAHCVAADGRGDAWVCDPARGRLLWFRRIGAGD